MKKQPEHKIQDSIRNYLVSEGWVVTLHPQGLIKRGSVIVASTPKGYPDLTACKNNLTLYIEVKTPRGRLRDEQKAFAKKMQQHGCANVYMVARSVDDVSRWLAIHEKEVQQSLF